MKKVYTLLLMFALSLVLVACGSETDDKSEGTTEQETENNDQSSGLDVETEKEESDKNETTDNESDDADENDEVALMKKLQYKEFELEVDYHNDKEYEAELELKHDNQVKAQIEDELNDRELEGSEAFEELYPIVEGLTIDQGTSKEDAIKEVLKAFSLDEDYKEFELEIEFHDGTEVEFEDEK